ncbi:hypothetical protein GCM10007394_02340 [Salinibacterium amurskyense]|nr:hypothetical protein GCM10007394_02340 [Salinibacterium amurskyense]
MEATRDCGNAASGILHSGNKFGGAVGDPDVASTLGDHALLETRERCDSRSEALLEIEFAVHGARGDVGNFWFGACASGEEFDDFVLDEGRVDIENNEKLCHNEAPSNDDYEREVLHLTTSLVRLSGSPFAPRP